MLASSASETRLISAPWQTSRRNFAYGLAAFRDQKAEGAPGAASESSDADALAAASTESKAEPEPEPEPGDGPAPEATTPTE